MTKLMEQAIEAIKLMPDDRQDVIARWMLDLADAKNGSNPAAYGERLLQRMRDSKRTLPPDYKFDRAELYREGGR